MSNAGWILSYSIIANNHCPQFGGGLYANTYNGVGFYSVNDVTNDLNTMVCQDGLIVNNTAGMSGGGMYFTDGNVFSFQHVMMKANIAYGRVGCGGGMLSERNNLFTFSYLEVVGNVAYAGGGICMKKNSALSIFHETKVIANKATYIGGGILSEECRIPIVWDIQSIQFQYNLAVFGSALFLYRLDDSALKLQTIAYYPKVLFHGNTALSTGCIFWIRDANMPVLADQWTKNATFLQNTAAYGADIATPPQRLQPSVNAVHGYEVIQYALPMNPPILFTLYDYYDEVVKNALNNTMNMTVTSYPEVILQITDAQCGSVNPYLTGVERVVPKHGVATFDDLIAYCTPNGYITLSASYEYVSLFASLDFIPTSSLQKFFVQHIITLHFRECISGEMKTNGICIPCPESTFNLFPNSTSSDSCTSCLSIEGIDSCHKDEIVVQKGYWRRHNTSSAVIGCVLDPSSCLEGNATGQTACAVGYEGPLCAICSTGYYLVSDQLICKECKELNQDGALIGLVIFGSLVTVLLLIIYLFYLRYKAEIKQWMDIFQHHYENIIVKTKIVVATYQVVSESADVFDVSYPTNFSRFMKSMDFLNLRFLSLTSFRCSYRSYNFMDELLWTTLIPILVSVAIFLSCVVHISFCITSKKQREEAIKTNNHSNWKLTRRDKILDRYLNVFFYLTYLCLPSVTTTIFKIFLCTNVDPNGEDSDEYDWFLTTDMSINCQDSYYYFWRLYAIFMILVYPVGIPMMYFWLLYTNREDIVQREDEEYLARRQKEQEAEPLLMANEQSTHEEEKKEQQSSQGEGEEGLTVEAGPYGFYDEDKPLNHLQLKQQQRRGYTALNKEEGKEVETETEAKKIQLLPPSVQRLAFLWSAYEPQYWYWEIIETTRRIFLTAVISVCAPGTSEQSVLSVIIAVVYIALYAFYVPYEDDDDDTLGTLGQLQTFFTYFVALVIQNALIRSQWDTALGIGLIIFNLFVVFFTFVCTIRSNEWVQEKVLPHLQQSTQSVRNSVVLFGDKLPSFPSRPATVSFKLPLPPLSVYVYDRDEEKSAEKKNDCCETTKQVEMIRKKNEKIGGGENIPLHAHTFPSSSPTVTVENHPNLSSISITSVPSTMEETRMSTDNNDDHPSILVGNSVNPFDTSSVSISFGVFNDMATKPNMMKLTELYPDHNPVIGSPPFISANPTEPTTVLAAH